MLNSKKETDSKMRRKAQKSLQGEIERAQDIVILLKESLEFLNTIDTLDLANQVQDQIVIENIVYIKGEIDFYQSLIDFIKVKIKKGFF